jgi:hypothetical protein
MSASPPAASAIPVIVPLKGAAGPAAACSAMNRRLHVT